MDGSAATRLSAYQPGGLLPGLLVAGAVAVTAFLLARLPGGAVAGPLGLALFLGMGWRLVFGLPTWAATGVRFSSRTVLRLGIVLLGVRLDFGLLYSSGIGVLLLDVAVIAVGLLTVLGAGQLLRLPRNLTWLLAIGSSICGASAIAAAAPIVGAKDEEVSQAVGIISVLGSIAVLGFTFSAPLLALPDATYGLLAGASLQEVGHALAAGAAGGGTALDAAAVAKLTRVALLAPVLLMLSGILLRRRQTGTPGNAVGVSPIPLFLVGFLLVGAVSSLNWIPMQAEMALQTGSVILTATAMAAIGMSVNFRALRHSGLKAAGVAATGFVFIVAVAAAILLR